MRILLWHVHGAWTTAFVQGRHEYVVPVLPDRGPDGRRHRADLRLAGHRHRAPARARCATRTSTSSSYQRPHELEHLPSVAGRARRDVPAFYVEHNAPQGRIADMRHPMADRDDLTLVHVTHFNALFWDAGARRRA